MQRQIPEPLSNFRLGSTAFEPLWGRLRCQILSTLKTHFPWYLELMEHTYITLVRSNNKFTWCLERDILYMAIKISLLTTFWQYFANIIGLRPSKNIKYFVYYFIHVPSKVHYWIHINYCIPALQVANYWSGDWWFSFWGIQIHHSTLCWHILSIALSEYNYLSQCSNEGKHKIQIPEGLRSHQKAKLSWKRSWGTRSLIEQVIPLHIDFKCTIHNMP